MRVLSHIMAAADTDIGSAMHSAACRAELAMNDVIKYGLEIVEKDGIRSAFEDEGKAPVWINTTAGCQVSGSHGGIGEKEGYGQELNMIISGQIE